MHINCHITKEGKLRFLLKKKRAISSKRKEKLLRWLEEHLHRRWDWAGLRRVVSKAKWRRGCGCWRLTSGVEGLGSGRAQRQGNSDVLAQLWEARFPESSGFVIGITIGEVGWGKLPGAFNAKPSDLDSVLQVKHRPEGEQWSKCQLRLHLEGREEKGALGSRLRGERPVGRLCPQSEH